MKFRQDIQALRGVAVLAVVFYHANLPFVRDGYLGVDVFFVISGFLITSMLIRAMQENRFSFIEFYRRRVYRLLPAALTVLAACAVFAFLLMTPSEQTAFGLQLLGAVTFTANITHWSATGYFNDTAELLPLLHTWSLAIEEQYYFVIPFLLWFCRSSLARWVVVGVGSALSFALFVHFSPDKPGATFFLTPFRAWELGVGSCLAMLNHRQARTLDTVFAALAAFILVWFLVDSPASGEYQSAINLFTVCVATAALIYCGQSLWEHTLMSRFLANVGEISYSLYLVHWPIFAFLNIVYLGGVGLSFKITLAALIVSFGGAWLLHRFVEQRFRIHGGSASVRRDPSFMPLILISLALVAAALIFIAGPKRAQPNVDIESPVIGFDDNCAAQNAVQNPKCRNDLTPEVVVLGDSFAMHLIPALSESEKSKIIQFTESTCPPSYSLGFYAPPKFGRQHAQACISNNRAALEYAISTENVSTVILSAQWAYVLPTPEAFKVSESGAQEVISVSDADYREDLLLLAKHLRSHDKRVVLVGAPPPPMNDAGKCNVRKQLDLIRLGQNAECEVSRSVAEKESFKVDRWLETLEQRGLPVYWLYDAFCDASTCYTERDGVVLYRDFGHMSSAGSRHIGAKHNLYESLLNMAR